MEVHNLLTDAEQKMEQRKFNKKMAKQEKAVKLAEDSAKKAAKKSALAAKKAEKEQAAAAKKAAKEATPKKAAKKATPMTPTAKKATSAKKATTPVAPTPTITLTKAQIGQIKQMAAQMARDEIAANGRDDDCNKTDCDTTGWEEMESLYEKYLIENYTKIVLG